MHEVEYTDHALSGERWYYDEVKDIDESRKVRFKRDGIVYYVNLIEDLFFSDISFKDEATGKNPLFLCSECDEETLVDGYRNPYGNRFTHHSIIPNDFNGKRYCQECFAKALAEKKILNEVH